MDVDEEPKENKKNEAMKKDLLKESVQESKNAPKSESKSESSESEENDSYEPVAIRYMKTPFKINNLSRVVPAEANYVSFIKNDRFSPVRKVRGAGGIIVLEDTKAGESVEIIKTVRQLNITEAPMPEPFTLSGEDLQDEVDE